MSDLRSGKAVNNQAQEIIMNVFSFMKEKYPKMATKYTADACGVSVRTIQRISKKHNNSAVDIGLSSCSEKFDSMAREFMNAKEEDKNIILSQAETMAKELESEMERKSADVYVKMMREVIEKGEDMIETEMERLGNIKKGKITKQKQDETQSQINILQSFRVKIEP